MKYYAAGLFALASLGGDTLITFAANEEPAQKVELRYLEPVGNLYLTVEVISENQKVKIFRGQSGIGGAFERSYSPNLSPDHNYVLLTQIESDDAETSDGLKMRHEVPYCNIIDVRTGCIIVREAGQFCGGEFTVDGKWKNPVYPDFDLLFETPRAKRYAEGALKPADSPNTSFNNLMACDLPSESNIEAYRTIMEKRVFDLDSDQLNALKNALNDINSELSK